MFRRKNCDLNIEDDPVFIRELRTLFLRSKVCIGTTLKDFFRMILGPKSLFSFIGIHHRCIIS
jgi:hypothetical protein